MWATLDTFDNNNLSRVALIPCPNTGRPATLDRGRQNIDEQSGYRRIDRDKCGSGLLTREGSEKRHPVQINGTVAAGDRSLATLRGVLRGSPPLMLLWLLSPAVAVAS